MTNMRVAVGKAVGIHFELKLDGGEVVDSSTGQEPLLYLHGHGDIVEGLEEALQGKAVGDRVQVTVPADRGYGARQDDAVQTIPRSDFPDDVEIEIGMQLLLEGQDGDTVPGWIIDISDDEVTIDLNHPLAGETLHFAVEVCSIRDASKDELAHGHLHGEGGHHH